MRLREPRGEEREKRQKLLTLRKFFELFKKLGTLLTMLTSYDINYQNPKGRVMPRQARLDAEGTLHHVVIRGIAKSAASSKTKRIDKISSIARAA